MNHALLLRLFLSSNFFSVHVALQYLRLYADHIGISHYLAHRLREFPISVWTSLDGTIIGPNAEIATSVGTHGRMGFHLVSKNLLTPQAPFH